MKLILKKIKYFIEKLYLSKKGEINYAQFEKLESKKYLRKQIQDDPYSKKHHPYHCTDECFRKR